MPTIPEAITIALQHHQAGRLQEAEAIYRQILEIQPANHVALHHMGLIAHHVGKPQIAVDYMSRAIAIHPDEATCHNNLGEAYRMMGNAEKAAAHFEQATRLKPAYADAFYNLGVLLHEQGKLEEAGAYYHKALSLQPASPWASNNLGNVLKAQGRLEDALSRYRDALASDPGFVEAHNNLGAALQAQGKLDEAVSHYRQALARKPDYAEAYSNLGIILQMLGNLEEAVAHYRQALSLKPDFADGYYNMGSVLQAQGKMEEAADYYRKALTVRPAFPKAARGLGFVLKFQGKPDEAMACYRQCLEVAPSDGLRILLDTAVPVIYQSRDHLLKARRQFQKAVGNLLKQSLSVRDPLVETEPINFFVAYQGLNDRDLQVKFARLSEQACPSLQYTADHCRSSPPRPTGGKIKIGFISMYFWNHTVGQLMRGIMAQLSRQLFSVTALTFPRNPDVTSEFIARHADQTIVLPTSLDAARSRIAEEQFDILFYADIGMDPFTYYLAFSRLAPVQCVTWGHPVTTGIKTMDYFVSSELLEPDNASRHYSERLIRLKQLPAYYYRPAISEPLKSRRELGLSESAHLYLCPQSLFKIHPDFDEMIAGILQSDPQGELILIDGMSKHWNTLLMGRFRETMPHVVDRIRFVPRLNGHDFLGLLSVVDVILDPLHWSGGNTTFEALTFGTPIVTLPSEFMRGRVTYGCYTQMGVLDCVAVTKDKYVKQAVRLGTDPTYREKIKARILAANHVLYENLEVVREYELAFLRMFNETQRT